MLIEMASPKKGARITQEVRHMKKEQEIFDDLARLCTSPGYAYAIAYLCMRNNYVFYKNTMTVDDAQHPFSSDKIIRTEIAILIGLLVKKEVDYELPAPSAMQKYLDKTEKLLKELHQSIFDPLTIGRFLREPIFYGPESAYDFQYRDLSQKKYAGDHEWLEINKGFSTQAAQKVARAVQDIHKEKLEATLAEMRKIHPDEWNFLTRACSH